MHNISDGVFGTRWIFLFPFQIPGHENWLYSAGISLKTEGLVDRIKSDGPVF